MKNSLLHNPPTIRTESLRILRALATILGMDLTTCDCIQGYVQSKLPLLQKVFVRPDELQLSADELVQLVKPLYGLSDSGDYFHETLHEHLTQHLQFEQFHVDVALRLKQTSNKLVAMPGTYVDDVLLASYSSAFNSFQKISQQTFDVKFDKSDRLPYLGICIDSSNPKYCTISQPKKIDRLRLLPMSTNLDDYRRARARIAYLIQTRPDVACAVSFAARTTALSFGKHHIKAHNNLVRKLRETRNLTFRFPRLNAENSRVVCFVDARYFDKVKGDAQIGTLTCLADDSDHCAIISYTSRKGKRIARSTTAAEAFAMFDGYDQGFSIKKLSRPLSDAQLHF